MGLMAVHALHSQSIHVSHPLQGQAVQTSGRLYVGEDGVMLSGEDGVMLSGM